MGIREAIYMIEQQTEAPIWNGMGGTIERTHKILLDFKTNRREAHPQILISDMKNLFMECLPYMKVEELDILRPLMDKIRNGANIDQWGKVTFTKTLVEDCWELEGALRIIAKREQLTHGTKTDDYGGDDQEDGLSGD